MAVLVGGKGTLNCKSIVEKSKIFKENEQWASCGEIIGGKMASESKPCLTGLKIKTKFMQPLKPIKLLPITGDWYLLRIIQSRRRSHNECFSNTGESAGCWFEPKNNRWVTTGKVMRIFICYFVRKRLHVSAKVHEDFITSSTENPDKWVMFI